MNKMNIEVDIVGSLVHLDIVYRLFSKFKVKDKSSKSSDEEMFPFCGRVIEK